MRSNPRMREILRTTDVTELSGRDIPPVFLEVVERGWSLPAGPDERTPLLVRRCLAYVCACLRTAQEQFGDTRVKAYVSLSFADTEEALLTSNVTFCTPLPDVRPYLPDLEAVTDAAVAEISLEDVEDVEDVEDRSARMNPRLSS
ncbi:hypothetical protein [Streptomyces anulatus]|uniref:hypothetical protein n=1 Tax=Streptomyces anulatus TaxID=1892 RepID=UPI00332AAA06